MKGVFHGKVTAKDPRPVWASVWRQVTSRDTENCKELLAALEQGGSLEATPSFKLFESLGRLRYVNWQKDSDIIPEAEISQLVNVSEKLYLRLSTFLKTGASALRLEEGISEALSFVDRGIHDDYRHLCYHDMEAELMFDLDRLGYAHGIAQETNFPLSQDIIAKLETVYFDVRNILPKLVGKFKAENDSPEFIEGSFPDFFWWRKWNSFTTRNAILKAYGFS